MSGCTFIMTYKEYKEADKMKNNTDDKAERILSIYTKLKQGKLIYREELSEKFGVSPRSIQRDITDIQNFLQNQFMETGNIQEIVFDKKAGGYRLQIKQTNELSGKAVLAVCKILLESRALMKSEMLPIIYSLTALCDSDTEAATVKDILHSEIQHYAELSHGQKLLDRLWDLEKAVKEHTYIEIRYKSMKESGEVIQKIKPVGILFSRFYFYLVAYRVNAGEEEICEQEDAFPTFYRVDRIQEYKFTGEFFQTPYAGQFGEADFRKRIQFLQEGKLRKIEFQYVGKSLESVLDRLPAAVIKQKDKEGYLVEVETFGPGLEEWLKRQAGKVKNIRIYEK